MKGMILSAGYGKRFEPLTKVVPKPLIPFGNKPVIEYTIEFLRDNGIYEVVINTHHIMGKIEEYLGSGERYGVKIIYSREKEILGTAGGIKAAETYLKDDIFVVINGDIIFDLDFNSLLNFHRSHNALATLVLRKDASVDKYGILGVNREGQIQRFLNHYMHCKQRDELIDTAFTGIHIIDPKVLNYIPPGRFYGISEELYPTILKEGGLFGYISDSYWQDIGHHTQYINAHIDLIDGRYKNNAYINKGKNIIGEKCNIDHASRIGEYAVIGDSCRITNSTISHSVIWDSADISDSSIKNCIVGSGVTVKGIDAVSKVIINKDGVPLISPFNS